MEFVLFIVFCYAEWLEIDFNIEGLLKSQSHVVASFSKKKKNWTLSFFHQLVKPHSKTLIQIENQITTYFKVKKNQYLFKFCEQVLYILNKNKKKKKREKEDCN